MLYVKDGQVAEFYEFLQGEDDVTLSNWVTLLSNLLSSRKEQLHDAIIEDVLSKEDLEEMEADLKGIVYEINEIKQEQKRRKLKEGNHEGQS